MLQTASRQKPGWESEQILLCQHHARNKFKIDNKLQTNTFLLLTARDMTRKALSRRWALSLLVL